MGIYCTFTTIIAIFSIETWCRIIPLIQTLGQTINMANTDYSTSLILLIGVEINFHMLLQKLQLGFSKVIHNDR